MCYDIVILVCLSVCLSLTAYLKRPEQIVLFFWNKNNHRPLLTTNMIYNGNNTEHQTNLYQHQPSRSLRSSNQLLLTVPRDNLTIGQCLSDTHLLSSGIPSRYPSETLRPSIGMYYSGVAQNHFTLIPSSPNLLHMATARASDSICA